MLRNWCGQSFDTRLHILTGNTPADWLTEPDLASALDLLGLADVPAPRCVLLPIDTEGFVSRHDALTHPLSADGVRRLPQETMVCVIPDPAAHLFALLAGDRWA